MSSLRCLRMSDTKGTLEASAHCLQRLWAPVIDIGEAVYECFA